MMEVNKKPGALAIALSSMGMNPRVDPSGEILVRSSVGLLFGIVIKPTSNFVRIYTLDKSRQGATREQLLERVNEFNESQIMVKAYIEPHKDFLTARFEADYIAVGEMISVQQVVLTMKMMEQIILAYPRMSELTQVSA